MANDFTLFLRQENMSDNTISAYTFAVKDYFAHQKELNKRIHQVPVTADAAGQAVVAIGPAFRTVWYEIVVK